jgi:hypothetical protein
MKCICFLQNNEDSLGALEAELREPKYGEYYLCQWVNAILLWHLVTFFVHFVPLDFSNILSKTSIERLADADEYEAVREVQVLLCLSPPLLAKISIIFARNTLLITRLFSPVSSL